MEYKKFCCKKIVYPFDEEFFVYARTPLEAHILCRKLCTNPEKFSEFYSVEEVEIKNEVSYTK